ncbi:MAG TPA: GNAT family N-acetyltransferase [Candidatus Acidoferrum sp.]|nr:GNAT family N-acetyltransferase [Candidatus Acidoferrum sp.]
MNASVRLRTANAGDIALLTRLINAAFVVERFVFDGNRVDDRGVASYLQSGKFLVAENDCGLAGCVYVEIRGDRGYVGLLSVDPQQQGTGLGRSLMDAAESYFHAAGCRAVDLRVISQRTPLPGFYRHLGYAETGTSPFAEGAHAKVPGHYIHMSKSLPRSA